MSISFWTNWVQLWVPLEAAVTFTITDHPQRMQFRFTICFASKKKRKEKEEKKPKNVPETINQQENNTKTTTIM